MHSYIRQGDTVFRIDALPATVAFTDILSAVEVRPDEHADLPWDTCDGLEHTRESGRVVLPWDSDLETFYRERGASKQVAKQLTARSMAQRREYLESIYRDGYSVWGVVCAFLDFHASVWGVDDSGVEDETENIALEIAAQMQEAGFQVTDIPATTPKAYRQNVHLFDAG